MLVFVLQLALLLLLIEPPPKCRCVDLAKALQYYEILQFSEVKKKLFKRSLSAEGRSFPTAIEEMELKFRAFSNCHMTTVQRLNCEGDSDQVYENVGLVTLKDIINEINQMQIIDEFDVIPENRRRLRNRFAEQSPCDFIDLLRARQFRLHLKSKGDLLSPGFEAYSVDEDGTYVRETVNNEEFLGGYADGVNSSDVSMHIDEQGGLSGTLSLPEETFVIEPAWRHISGAAPSQSIIYRLSDMKLKSDQHGDRTPMCAAAVADEKQLLDDQLLGAGRSCHKRNCEMLNSSVWPSFRLRRQTPSWTERQNRCGLKLVADHKFFRSIGAGSTATTIRYIITVIDRVNAIYTRTVWSDSEEDAGFSNMGFTIKKIIVYKSPSRITGHYNMDYDGWDVGSLLQRFSDSEGSDAYCLVHLFTYQAFKGGVLGLGYIASPRQGTSGGICCTPTMNIVTGRSRYFNTALSSARSLHGGPVVTREADIVTAHELGHNWGSLHDPITAECSPMSKAGGPYIMFMYSVSGFDSNNKLFSPCSRRTIKAVLLAKAMLCFQEEAPAFCGNQRVEEGEECDAGLTEPNAEDQCCTTDCKLKPFARCSYVNSPCCDSQCQIEQRGKLCQSADLTSCKENSKCNGKSPECPDQTFLPDGTECLDEGECRNGECVSFCERQGINMSACICENVTESCFRCCRPLGSNECHPFLRPPEFSMPLTLTDGTRCIHGYCKNGVCQREVQDIVEHIWNIVERLDINTAWKLLRDNMVSAIIFLTLCIWVPFSVVIYRIDLKTKQEREEEEKWKRGDTFVIDENRIKKVQEIQRIVGTVRNC